MRGGSTEQKSKKQSDGYDDGAEKRLSVLFIVWGESDVNEKPV